MTDVFVIGTGPAGITAAVYAVRAGLSVTAVGKDTGALEKAHLIENYYGFAEPISGEQLHRNGVENAKRLGVHVNEGEEVFEIECDVMAQPPVFSIKTNRGVYESKTLILATGSARKAPAIPGLKELEGAGVSYCATCDAFFYRQLPVAVIGSAEYAVNEASHLAQVSSGVTILTNGEEMTAKVPAGITVDTRKIAKIQGDPTVSGVVFEDGSTLQVNGVFVAVGTAGATEMARRLGAVDMEGKLMVDANMATPVKGFFAAGDCNGGVLQIAKAGYEGMVAGKSAIAYLREVSK